MTAASPTSSCTAALSPPSDRANPAANAVAIKDGAFVAVGRDADVMKLAGPATRIIDLKGRRALPGLIDNHLHIIRGGLNFNMELRWDGVRSLADAIGDAEAAGRDHAAAAVGPRRRRLHRASVRREAAADHRGAQRRRARHAGLPAASLRPRAAQWRRAARRGYTKDTPDPAGGEITRDARGNPTGLLLAKPNAGILYATLAKGPKLPFEYQLNSTRHFMRELNRLRRHRRDRRRRRLPELSR